MYRGFLVKKKKEKRKKRGGGKKLHQHEFSLLTLMTLAWTAAQHMYLEAGMLYQLIPVSQTEIVHHLPDLQGRPGHLEAVLWEGLSAEARRGTLVHRYIACSAR